MLNLRNLSERKEDILDMLIMTDNIFGTPLASMQQKCEVRKRDDEAIPGKLSQQHLWPCDECSRDESGNPASHSVQDPKTNEAPASPCISTQATDECGLSACQSPGQKKEGSEAECSPFTCRVLECVARAVIDHSHTHGLPERFVRFSHLDHPSLPPPTRYLPLSPE